MRHRKPSTGTPCFEVQIHPAEIRHGVWYLFFTRRRLTVTGIGLGLFLLFLLLNLVVAPQVVAGIWRRAEYRSLLAEREQQGVRLRSLVERLGDLDRRGDELRTRMNRIYLAYGLDGIESSGQGGYPFTPGPVPDSIYSGSILHGATLESHAEEQLRVVKTFIEEIQAFEAAHQDEVRSTPSVSPLRDTEYVLTSPFGTRRSPFTKSIDFHAGIDLAAPEGTPIHAPADGVVIFAGRYPLRQSVAWWRYGNLVALRNGDRFVTLFGHCKEVAVRAGQRVRQGDVIALVGSTGWSTSSHLHYEVRRRAADGALQPVDPRIYILDRRWRDEERLLVRARSAPDAQAFEPLPRLISR